MPAAPTKKTCKDCNRVLPMDAFYLHPQMLDGRLNSCKACKIAYQRARYRATREDCMAYERKRSRQPERKRKIAEYLRRGREREPEK